MAEREEKTTLQKFQLRIRVTSQCRYNAAKRLTKLNQFNFGTTTIVSLGLIFIPLMQSSGVKLHLSSGVLGAVQIFLAVTVLVYSVIIATAQCDLRSDRLTKCGDKLKELNRKVETIEPTKYDEYAKKYNRQFTEIVAESDNHMEQDYSEAVLDMTGDYSYIKFIKKMEHRSIIYTSYIKDRIIPVALILLEFFIILDMLGVHNFFPFLK